MSVTVTVKTSPTDKDVFLVTVSDGFVEVVNQHRNYFSAMSSALGLQEVYGPADLRDLVGGIADGPS